MRNLKITLQYNGENYCGWQRQPNSPGIQGTVENAIYEITKEKVNITGSGRTDAGVHALGQVANFKTNSNIPASRIPDALNAKYPKFPPRFNTFPWTVSSTLSCAIISFGPSE